MRQLYITAECVTENGRAFAKIEHGPQWASSWTPWGGSIQPLELTALELDRLIADLAEVRDRVRAANRPKHRWGTP